jgi:hypothetical protein
MAYDPAYADKAEQEASKEAMIFNCTQSKELIFSCVLPLMIFAGAHQNTLENAPVVVLT